MPLIDENTVWFALSGGFVTRGVGPDWPTKTVCRIDVPKDAPEGTSDKLAQMLAGLPDLIRTSRETLEDCKLGYAVRRSVRQRLEDALKKFDSIAS